MDESLEPVRIAAALLHELCRHALESQPEECCGLVSGDGVVRFGRAYRCRNDMSELHRLDPTRNPRDGREAFHMNEADQQRALEEIEGKGERVTAVYHSHVGKGAYFSELDQLYAGDAGYPFPDADQIVIAVFERRVFGHAVFRRSRESGRFEGRRIAPEAP
ncbi:MAG TPA: Mov34/MPN/PAD-1 family protein [Myxococcota bacterium]|jgi:proteasome lid subunit RPN8/RPN11|nr:Mov34/MPN/PAD-1 family protein [Myxococcota bacterium]